MFPKNCNKCEHSNTCQSCYGARGCKYEKEIVEEVKDFGSHRRDCCNQHSAQHP